jgi:PAS domain S-box-containing protein
MLVALVIWNMAYGVELLSLRPGTRLFWGDIKYVGICLLTPAWVVFILCYTGRGRLVTRWLLLALLVEPVVLLALLGNSRTHDLIRHLPKRAPDPSHEAIKAGPIFWFHLVYTQTLLVGVTALFVWSLFRLSRAYWLQAAALVAAAVMPLVASLLFNLHLGPLGRLDLTSVAFTASGAVLAWGLFRQRLLRLAPLARDVLVERMTDGVIVLDAYGHIVDANAAAAALLQVPKGEMMGRSVEDVLPPDLLRRAPATARGGFEARMVSGDEERTLELRDTPLGGRQRQVGGRLLVLRDITDRARLERRLRELLADQARVATSLSESLRPSTLPLVPGVRLAGCYRPAGSGHEIGGDFYDVFPAGRDWAFMLGDVSGKGARAAATTASARYTLRALAAAGHDPVAALRLLHESIDGQHGEETYLTVAHGRIQLHPAGGLRIRFVLGGHPQPFVLCRNGTVKPTGEPGSAIGLFPDVELTETEIRLHPGESLFLFSDGVSEARLDDALFGESGLQQALSTVTDQPAEVIADTILRRVLELQSGDAADDIAILVLQPDS